MAGIWWLASYPKSGNTWLRAFLAYHRHYREAPESLNDLLGEPMAAYRRIFDDVTGLSSSEMNPDEIAHLRPKVYRQLGTRNQDAHYLKIHDANHLVPGGERLIPANVTHGAIYLLRNPLDVAHSWAHHLGTSIDEAISGMGDEERTLADQRRRTALQLPQLLLSWGAHVRSWVDSPDFPVLILRYEDLLSAPEKEFSKVLRFIGQPEDEERLQWAIEQSSFDKLRTRERNEGFNQTLASGRPFFRSGKTGQWKKLLSHKQVAAIVEGNRDEMARFGYLAEIDI
jgi:aryl sulfotransferase